MDNTQQNNTPGVPATTACAGTSMPYLTDAQKVQVLKAILRYRDMEKELQNADSAVTGMVLGMAKANIGEFDPGAFMFNLQALMFTPVPPKA